MAYKFGKMVVNMKVYYNLLYTNVYLLTYMWIR